MAEALLADGKNLNGAVKAIENEARKQGNHAVMRDEEIFDVVDKYFGLPFNLASRMESKRQVDGDAPTVAATTPDSLKLDFDDFM
jgi:hypothetical protein